VGDPGLGPGHAVDVAVPHGPGGEAAQVRAGVGLGEHRRGQDLARGDPGQPLLLLLVGAAQADELGRDLGAGAQRPHPDESAAHLLRHHAHGDLAHAEPAVLLGHGEAEHAELRHLLDDGGGDELVVQVPLVGGGDDLVLDEAADLVAHQLQRLVLEAEGAEMAVGDQGRDAGAHASRVAAPDQGLHRGRRQGHELGLPEAHVGRAQDLHLAHGDAARELAEVLAEGRLEDEGLELAQGAGGLEPPRPVQGLGEGHDVGFEPGQPVGGVLVGLEKVRWWVSRRSASMRPSRTTSPATVSRAAAATAFAGPSASAQVSKRLSMTGSADDMSVPAAPSVIASPP
jgi:hypothetical protein